MKKLFVFLFFCLSAAQSLAQWRSSRLMATAGYNYTASVASNFYLIDSVNYTYYYPDKGGDLNSVYIPYNDAVSYRYDIENNVLLKVKKSLQQFDVNHHRSVRTNYLWNVMWREMDNTLFASTLEDSLLNKINQVWNSSMRGWDNKSKQDYTYDAAKNKTADILSFWDEGKRLWVFQERTVYDYDVSANLIKKTFQEWNQSSASWDNIISDSFIYNAAGKVSRNISFLWDKTTSGWKTFKQVMYIYDAAGYLLTQTDYGWDASSASWINAQRKRYTNNAAGNILESSMQNWNATDTIWENVSRQLNIYDAKEHNINLSIQFWDKLTASFKNSVQVIHTYDGRGNMKTELSSSWDASSGSWRYGELDSFDYNSFDQLTYFTFFTNWDTLTKSWGYNEFDQKFFYYYEGYTTSFKESVLPAAEVDLYPVPVNNSLNVRLRSREIQAYTCRIMDLQGRVMQQWNISPTNLYNGVIPVEGLTAGAYLIEFTGNKDRAFVKTFVVHH